MGNKKKQDGQTRRGFFSLFLSGKEKSTSDEKVKMLTADGKLVEVDRAVYEQLSGKQKATNKDILNWMDNPSKDNTNGND